MMDVVEGHEVLDVETEIEIFANKSNS